MAVEAENGDRSEPAAQAKGYIVVDAKGNVLAGKNFDQPMHPASMTKMMTVHLAFQAIKDGRMSPDTPIRISKAAAQAFPHSMHVDPGDEIPAKKLIEAAAIKSANGAARALAEHLGGSEAKFAAMMTEKARELGMTHSRFFNASGLPPYAQGRGADPNGWNVSTPADMARLNLALNRDHGKEFQQFFGASGFHFNGSYVHGHNPLVNRDDVIGGKTGFIQASGFNNAVVADGANGPVAAVVFGGSNARQRDAFLGSLLNQTKAHPKIVAKIDLSPTSLAATQPQVVASAPQQAPAPAVAAPAAPSLPHAAVMPPFGGPTPQPLSLASEQPKPAPISPALMASLAAHAPAQAGAKMSPQADEAKTKGDVDHYVQNAYLAIGQQETRNRNIYGYRNLVGGEHQVKFSNLNTTDSGWARVHLGRPISAKEFMANPEAREKIVEGQIRVFVKEALKKSLSGDDVYAYVAARWHSDKTPDRIAGKRDGLGKRTVDFVAEVVARANNGGALPAGYRRNDRPTAVAAKPASPSRALGYLPHPPKPKLAKASAARAIARIAGDGRQHHAAHRSKHHHGPHYATRHRNHQQHHGVTRFANEGHGRRSGHGYSWHVGGHRVVHHRGGGHHPWGVVRHPMCGGKPHADAGLPEVMGQQQIAMVTQGGGKPLPMRAHGGGRDMRGRMMPAADVAVVAPNPKTAPHTALPAQQVAAKRAGAAPPVA